MTSVVDRFGLATLALFSSSASVSLPVFVALRERLASAGHQPGDLKMLRRGDTVAARFFFITDPDGYKIEVLAREGHYV